jgi:hypothetical protein
MSVLPKTLAEIQEECRRFATEVGAPEVHGYSAEPQTILSGMPSKEKTRFCGPVASDLFWFLA